jgi:hypothetical protein
MVLCANRIELPSESDENPMQFGRSRPSGKRQIDQWPDDVLADLLDALG